jgi:hypothetical protein
MSRTLESKTPTPPLSEKQMAQKRIIPEYKKIVCTRKKTTHETQLDTPQKPCNDVGLLSLLFSKHKILAVILTETEVDIVVTIQW